MKERFLEIKGSVSKKLGQVLKCALDTPPPYEVVVESFRHGKKCSKTRDLVKEEFEEFITAGDGGIWGMSMGGSGIRINVKYIKCPECDISLRYSD